MVISKTTILAIGVVNQNHKARGQSRSVTEAERAKTREPGAKSMQEGQPGRGKMTAAEGQAARPAVVSVPFLPMLRCSGLCACFLIGRFFVLTYIGLTLSPDCRVVMNA